jgi:hypothetical protein
VTEDYYVITTTCICESIGFSWKIRIRKGHTKPEMRQMRRMTERPANCPSSAEWDMRFSNRIHIHLSQAEIKGLNSSRINRIRCAAHGEVVRFDVTNDDPTRVSELDEI